MSERELIGSIRWDVCPPALNVVYAPILSPKPTMTERSLVVCPEFVGVKTHWIGERTTGCVGKENGCEGCIAHLKTRWKGYMGVLRLEDSRLWLAEFTPRAYQDVANAVTDAKKLRGWHLCLSRPGKSKYGHVRAALRPPSPVEKEMYLPDPFDIRRTLLCVWERLGRLKEVKPPGDEGGEEVPG